MSQELHVTAAIASGVSALVVFGTAYPGLSTTVQIVIVAGASLLGWAAWIYSPLPNRTVGPMGTKHGGGFWGLSDDDK